MSRNTASRWSRCRPICTPTVRPRPGLGAPGLEKCAELGIPVKLHTGDGRLQHPVGMGADDQGILNVDFIMAHFGVQTGGVYVFEPMQWAMELPNVYCESGWCLQSRIVEFAKVLPTHKILFGTDTPPNEPGMWLRLLEVLCHEPPQGLNLDEDTLEEYRATTPHG